MTSTSWRNLCHVVRQRAASTPERTLFRFEGKECTFGAFEERTNQLANVLVDRGVKRGERVAVMMANGVDFPTAWMAIAKTGAITVPLNTQYRGADLRFTLNDSGAILAIGDSVRIEALEEVAADCRALRSVAVLGRDGGGTDPGLAGEMGSAPAHFEPRVASSEELVNIQYTSGTTGFPKGCMLSHRYFLEFAQGVLFHTGLTEQDVAVTAQPFSYIDPQWTTVACLLATCPLVILPRFSASTFWRSIGDAGVTFVYLLGTMPVYLLKRPEDSAVDRGHRVRLAVCSGIPPRLHAQMEKRWGVPWREAYGSTESGFDLYVPVDDAESVGSGAVGIPAPGKEVKLVDRDGREVPDGDVGELIVRGPYRMLGYFHDPQATRDKIRDGWLHTRDLMFRDARGYYHMVGRTKDMIRRTGENISAREVETVLCEHDAIRAAAVVPVPDELRGEEVKAFIQLRDGSRADAVDPQGIVEFVRDRLAAFKAPRYVEFVDTFPLTPSERIAKHQLLRLKTDQREGSYDADLGQWN